MEMLPREIGGSALVDRWVQDHQKDAWRKQAKASGYRARSAFKLKQIQDRHKIIDVGDSVLDVGCHPGGWAQVATELVGESGWVIGVDLAACQPVEGSILRVGDITEPNTQQREARNLIRSNPIWIHENNLQSGSKESCNQRSRQNRTEQTTKRTHCPAKGVTMHRTSGGKRTCHNCNIQR